MSTVHSLSPCIVSSTTAPPPKPAALKAKPGSAQHKKQAEREAMLSQQAAAVQTDSASSVADLKPATDKVKPQKSAAGKQPQIVTAVPASNQPQIVIPSQPASKAVQSSVVPAGVGVQPTLVELDSVEIATATEVVSSPGAVLPITWLQQHLSYMLLYHCLPFATLCLCVCVCVCVCVCDSCGEFQ